MKYLYLLLLVSLLSCKRDQNNKTPMTHEDIPSIVLDQELKDTIVVIHSDDPDLNKVQSIKLKQKQLIEKADERDELQKLIIEKKYLKDEKTYSIDFTYPLLNESLSLTHSNFNEYINDYYVDITGTEAILKNQALVCDTILSNHFREKRYIDYKIYNVNDQLLSVLFYKEKFYSGTLHPTYTFDCMNFDLNRGVFMQYEDFFVQGSEDELTNIINEEISKKINKGDMYYDCWKISSEDFFEHKNNFVINDDVVEYYFDDCIMCPSYTGSYSIKLPVMNLLSVLKKYDFNPLIL